MVGLLERPHRRRHAGPGPGGGIGGRSHRPGVDRTEPDPGLVRPRVVTSAAAQGSTTAEPEAFALLTVAVLASPVPATPPRGSFPVDLGHDFGDGTVDDFLRIVEDIDNVNRGYVRFFFDRWGVGERALFEVGGDDQEAFV